MTVLREKPVFGSPCNGCGRCCLISPCGTARVLLNQHVGACQALTSDGLGGYRCGLLTLFDEPTYREAMAIAIGAGVGCDMADTEADMVARDEKLMTMREAAREARRRASPAAERLLTRARLTPP